MSEFNFDKVCTCDDIGDGQCPVHWRENELQDALILARNENLKLREWISDLQSGFYVNCVYCGYRYGKKGEVPTSQADVLKGHIEQCPEHPMSKLKQENVDLREELEELTKNHDRLCRNYDELVKQKVF